MAKAKQESITVRNIGDLLKNPNNKIVLAFFYEFTRTCQDTKANIFLPFGGVYATGLANEFLELHRDNIKDLSKSDIDKATPEYRGGFLHAYTEFHSIPEGLGGILMNDSNSMVNIVIDRATGAGSLGAPDGFTLVKDKGKSKPFNWYQYGVRVGVFYKAWEIILNERPNYEKAISDRFIPSGETGEKLRFEDFYYKYYLQADDVLKPKEAEFLRHTAEGIISEKNSIELSALMNKHGVQGAENPEFPIGENDAFALFKSFFAERYFITYKNGLYRGKKQLSETYIAEALKGIEAFEQTVDAERERLLKDYGIGLYVLASDILTNPSADLIEVAKTVKYEVLEYARLTSGFYLDSNISQYYGYLSGGSKISVVYAKYIRLKEYLMGLDRSMSTPNNTGNTAMYSNAVNSDFAKALNYPELINRCLSLLVHGNRNLIDDNLNYVGSKGYLRYWFEAMRKSKIAPKSLTKVKALPLINQLFKMGLPFKESAELSNNNYSDEAKAFEGYCLGQMQIMVKDAEFGKGGK